VTLAQALAAVATLGVARLDAQLLLLHVLGRPSSERAWLLVHDGDAIDPERVEGYLALARRRAAREPLAYLVGEKEFYGLRLKIDPRVLVPRPETETLVDWALELVKPGWRVVDLGTGSGAIALAIKKHRPQAHVEAIDRSEEALAVARANAHALALDVRFARSSWLTGSGACYDLIVGNPPYVREDDPHLRDLQHEPLGALASGADGLADIRAIVEQAPAHLNPGGWLLLEHGYDQAAAVRELLQNAGLREVGSRCDLAGIERVTGGRRAELG
jgi:release factor glutamine methyltransferase